MYNRHTVQHSRQVHAQLQMEKSKSQAWMLKYRVLVRPDLVSRHQRRIAGFAKKMECEPFVMPEQEGEQRQAEKGGQLRSESMWRISTTSRKMTKTQSDLKPEMNANVCQIYNKTTHTFRERNKNLQIHPPMRYNCHTSQKQLQRATKSQSVMKKAKTSLSNMSKVSRVSRDDMHSTISDNYSEYDTMDLNNILLQSQIRADLSENQRRVKEEQQMKALSHDKLYFKSLVDYQAKMRDKQVRAVLKNILVRCKVFKPVHKKPKQQLDKDLFAEVVLKTATPHAPSK